jgi:hypothetical protein
MESFVFEYCVMQSRCALNRHGGFVLGGEAAARHVSVMRALSLLNYAMVSFIIRGQTTKQ